MPKKHALDECVIQIRLESALDASRRVRESEWLKFYKPLLKADGSHTGGQRNGSRSKSWPRAQGCLTSLSCGIEK